MGANLEGVLASNLISKDAYRAARADDYDTFLEIRADTIHRAALALTGWPAMV